MGGPRNTAPATSGASAQAPPRSHRAGHFGRECAGAPTVPPRRPLRARVRRRHCRAWRWPRGYFRRSRPMGALTGEPRVRTAAQPGTRFLSAVEREPAQDEVRPGSCSAERGRASPLTKVKLINELNEREAQLGVAEKVSWHSQYKDSAWIFLGGLPYELTEGDIICVFSQYGEVVNINLVRDKKTGKSKGFCFLCYEDQRSTILAVDNFNGIKIKGRTIRVDHVSNYRVPKDSDDLDDVTKRLQEKGCEDPMPSGSLSEDSEDDKPAKKHKKDKKEKKKKKKDKEKTNREIQPNLPVSSSSPRRKMLKEKDASDSKKLSSKNSEKGPKSEFREGRMQCHSSPEVRTNSRSGAEARDREARKEQARHEHRSSSRKEARDEKNRDRDKDRSSDTCIDWHGGPFERNSSRRSRSRSRSRDTSHRHKSSWHSRGRRSPSSRDRRHH